MMDDWLEDQDEDETIVVIRDTVIVAEQRQRQDFFFFWVYITTIRPMYIRRHPFENATPPLWMIVVCGMWLIGQ